MKQGVLLLVLLCCSFLAAAEDTLLKLYRPFAGEQAVPVVKEQLNGRCDSQSHLILREDAWRCQAKGTIYDPCFVKNGSNETTLLCPRSPWSTEIIALNVDKPLNNEEHQMLDMSRTYPWAIELVTGERCQAIESAELYDSMPIRYRCTDEHFLLGSIQRCNPLWSVLEKTNNGVVTVDLQKAWF